MNLENGTVSFGDSTPLSGVSLGVQAGQRIGVVGRNGAGKSTLLRVLAGDQDLDSGRVSVTSGTHRGALRQMDTGNPTTLTKDWVVGERSEHEWAGDAQARDIIGHLVSPSAWERPLGELSGGERRRADLARLLIEDLDLLLLDEPTNHLDVEVISWLAAHLKSRPDLAVVTVTHDRWFLDETCEQMWEVVNGNVEEYEGGYSAFVLAKAERQRQESASQAKRNNLLRKELAWLRRGPPARTSKPKFRIDAANALIEAEPPARNDAELLSFANARLGKTVLELQDATVGVGDLTLIDHVTWNIGPGDRIGILGPNGAGKSTLVRALLGDEPLRAGKLITGQTVKPAHLSQRLEELEPTWRVLEAVERISQRVDLGKGRELSASQLLERLGFPASVQWTPVGDLSGGERRRLQLTRLLMSEPNVLILDEPTNDFDTETLAALEDLLDGFAGTLLVVSHDRYFLERVCDTFVALLGDRKLTGLPRGVDQYLEQLDSAESPIVPSPSAPQPAAPKSSAAEQRERRKALDRIERQLDKLHEQEQKLLAQLEVNATNHEKILEIDAELRALRAQTAEREAEWMEWAGD